MIDYDKEHRNCSHDLKLTFPFHALLNLYTRFTMQKYKKNKKNKDIQLFFAIFASVLLIIELYNMEREDILKRVEEIFREELGQNNLVLTDETTADDVEGWDSLSHVQLVAVMEDAFGIEFSSREILSWDNVGDLIDSIQKKV